MVLETGNGPWNKQFLPAADFFPALAANSHNFRCHGDRDVIHWRMRAGTGVRGHVMVLPGGEGVY